jgi:hypothetical protein
VKSAKLLPDGKTVFLEIPDFKPVMQMLIKYDLEAKDGTVMRDEVACTLNAVGGQKMVCRVGSNGVRRHASEPVLVIAIVVDVSFVGAAGGSGTSRDWR